METFNNHAGWYVLKYDVIGDNTPENGITFDVSEDDKASQISASIVERAFQAAGISYGIKYTKGGLPSLWVHPDFLITVEPP